MARFLTLWLGGFIQRLTKDEEGQGLAEYALILVLVAIAAIGALIFLGGSINTTLSTVGSTISAQSGS